MKHPILTGAVATTSAIAAVMLAGSPAIAATASSASPTSSTAAASCDRTPWQSIVQGTPSLKSGDASGDYMFHNSTGFHLRVTHPGHRREVFSGEITSSSAMSISRYKLEKGDVLRLSANRRTMVFVLSNYGYLDGVDVHTNCAATLTVSHLNLGNKALPSNSVYLGAHKVHPAHIPFTVHRRATA